MIDTTEVSFSHVTCILIFSLHILGGGTALAPDTWHLIGVTSWEDLQFLILCLVGFVLLLRVMHGLLGDRRDLFIGHYTIVHRCSRIIDIELAV